MGTEKKHLSLVVPMMNNADYKNYKGLLLTVPLMGQAVGASLMIVADSMNVVTSTGKTAKVKLPLTVPLIGQTAREGHPPLTTPSIG